jgi:hypothetical protein
MERLQSFRALHRYRARLSAREGLQSKTTGSYIYYLRALVSYGSCKLVFPSSASEVTHLTQRRREIINYPYLEETA